MIERERDSIATPFVNKSTIIDYFSLHTVKRVSQVQIVNGIDLRTDFIYGCKGHLENWREQKRKNNTNALKYLGLFRDILLIRMGTKSKKKERKKEKKQATWSQIWLRLQYNRWAF